MKLRVLLILIIFLTSFRSLLSQEVAHLNDDDNCQPVGKFTYYFKDANYLNIEQILQLENQQKFKPYNQNAPNFGSIADAVWFRFDVAKEVNESFYLQVGSAFIDSIALYAVDSGHVKEVFLSGDNYAFSNRLVKVTTFLFPLNIPNGGKQTYFLRAKTMQPFFFPLRIGTLKSFMEDTHFLDFIQGIYAGFMLLILLYNLFLYFSTKEKIYLLYVAYVFSITWFMSTIFQYIFEYAWPNFPIINQYAVASSGFTILTATLFTRSFLHTQSLVPRLHKVSNVFIGVGILVLILVFTPFQIPALMLAQMGILLMAFYFLISGVTVLRKGYAPAKFYLVAWSFLIAGFIAAILESVNILPVMYYINSMQIGSAIEVTLLSLALADRINLYKKEREVAQAAALKSVKEQAELIKKQNIILEEKVTERTIELNNSLEKLQSTQTQLIHSGKLASLGELTAGIAHEIQNPLNFVNNFSELSVDLVKELNEEITKPQIDKSLVTELFDDLKQNQEKINLHGKRASSIVKSMLEHSRERTGIKELTDINVIVDEYFRLSYHGLRAKDKNFNTAMESHFDQSLPKVNIIPQDFGRVVLNLINNAFYAVNERRFMESKMDPINHQKLYEPCVSVTTERVGNNILIHVKDNGAGIPENIKDKIFNPFFTTKPPGQGTGLGLSLSHEIIEKGHGGVLNVDSTEGVGTEFIIQIPISK